MNNLNVYDLEARRLKFNRKLLVLVHLVLGFVAAALSISQISSEDFQYWHPGRFATLSILIPSLLPLAISFVYSYRFATHLRLRVYLYLAIVVIGFLLTTFLYTGLFDVELNVMTVLWGIVVQTAIYIWMADVLLNAM